MTQLSIPHFDGPPATPTWLRPADHKAGEILICVVGPGRANRFDRLTSLSPDSVQSYRVQRRQTGFSWRSAWLGALSALGLVGGLAAAAEATQPEQPIRIALPLARPAVEPAPLALVQREGASNAKLGRSSISPIALSLPVLRPDSPAFAPVKLASKPAKVSKLRNNAGSAEFYRADPIQAAAQRAILSGVAQAWTFGGLTGVVVAGPLELRSKRACHRIALWAESHPGSGDSMGFTSCLSDGGDWKTPTGLREEPLDDSVDLLHLP